MGDDIQHDLYAIRASDFRTSLIQTIGQVPSPRAGHVCVSVSTVLIVWGGHNNLYSDQESLDDGLYLLNLGEFAVLYYWKGRYNFIL